MKGTEREGRVAGLIARGPISDQLQGLLIGAESVFTHLNATELMDRDVGKFPGSWWLHIRFSFWPVVTSIDISTACGVFTYDTRLSDDGVMRLQSILHMAVPFSFQKSSRHRLRRSCRYICQV